MYVGIGGQTWLILHLERKREKRGKRGIWTKTMLDNIGPDWEMCRIRLRPLFGFSSSILNLRNTMWANSFIQLYHMKEWGLNSTLFILLFPPPTTKYDHSKKQQSCWITKTTQISGPIKEVMTTYPEKRERDKYQTFSTVHSSPFNRRWINGQEL